MSLYSCALSVPLIVSSRLDSWRNRNREEEDDLSFPDEVDTPKDIPAKTRFQRFRGMRSFRTSPWDAYENLPRDYARIFQFEDFKRTERGVRRRAEEEMHIVEVRNLIWSFFMSLTPRCTARRSGHGLPEGRTTRSRKHTKYCPVLALATRA